ncbi:hypothetical protein J2W25_001877 [Variovorax boronicumulans]|uniref:DUF1488 domain-containing protein n=1 Tax=Variovorax boronicumulans TaxID=436515 RepID=A0AAW8DTE4_9BURK|nr:DUF1488 family protein [Variovorax boronicumulans]MDP9877571.1 hypothetical protein [Variovorax boronicumulans]MDP9917451.1 hypothetical protein [Variovorax boronicumulans]MDP9922856.1 hypothetical protein [Variovorax boronicumulans]
MSDTPYFHDASGSVRFWVGVEGSWFVSASIGREALRYHFCTAENADPLETFGHHVDEIEAAVRRRLSQGAMEPVMLRENDLKAPVL